MIRYLVLYLQNPLKTPTFKPFQYSKSEYMQASDQKLILLILDGWGHGTNAKVSALAQANTPFIDSLYKNYPNAELCTHGELVGLPKGQMGNSEVGHLNIGAGRIVYQELLRINNAVKDNSLAQNKVLLEAINYAQKNDKPIHLMGLVSDGGVHSHINHLKALCSILQENKLKKVFIHAFTDGRDTDPKGGIHYLTDLTQHLEETTGQIASVIGRYYAMDRDKRWERVRLAYDLLVNGKGEKTTDILSSISKSYEGNTTDEFIKPIVKIDGNGQPLATIQTGDVVLCFNFRTDRCREITMALTQEDMPDYGMQKKDLFYTTMTRYDKKFKDVKVVFEKDNLQETLGEILEKVGKKQIRIAETEKYPHVTFFFSGGREKPFEGEERIMIPSPKVATYDLQPEMSALLLTDAILPKIAEKAADFICLNFANTDMVGHTGVFEAAVKAAETVNDCTQKIVTSALQNDYQLLIIADHGNADKMLNENGSPNTAHTTNLVPIFLVGKNVEKYQLKNGKLADVAPTILELMGIAVSSKMNGASLIQKS